MSETIETQVAVLGAGPGGYAAAFLAADKGMKVTLIDAKKTPGGTCLHVGCIPSKALLHTAKLITDSRHSESVGVKFGEPKIDVEAVRGSWFEVVEKLSSNLEGLCKARKVDFVNGRGTFVDDQTIQIEDGPTIKFEHCVLATGSSPTMPEVFRIDSPRVMDSTGALQLEDIPNKLLVVGGGYIGLELGYVYSALGSEVTVVEFTDGLLPGVDRDLVAPLHKRLESMFGSILLNTKVVKLEKKGEQIVAQLEGEEVEDKSPSFDRVLISVGRYPNSRNLGLDKAGVEMDEQGFVQVDEQRRTTAERIFAVGDVAGQPMLAHKASYEGKVAVEAMAGEPTIFDCQAIPAVVFTDPEIAWCGLTETEARAQKRKIKRVRFPWGASGRALTLGRTEGMTKVICDPETERVLGIGIVGVEAGEMISEAMLAIEMAASARDIALTMHPHPTLSETVGEASEMIFGPSTHFQQKKK